MDPAKKGQDLDEDDDIVELDADDWAPAKREVSKCARQARAAWRQQHAETRIQLHSHQLINRRQQPVPHARGLLHLPHKLGRCCTSGCRTRAGPAAGRAAARRRGPAAWGAAARPGPAAKGDRPAGTPAITHGQLISSSSSSSAPEFTAGPCALGSLVGRRDRGRLRRPADPHRRAQPAAAAAGAAACPGAGQGRVGKGVPQLRGCPRLCATRPRGAPGA